MKFAILNGIKSEPQPSVTGECPGCGAEVNSKCGDQRIWHWAHKTSKHCDHWWETETEWHRGWKGHFPREWQEVVHRDGSGERHIADVKTGHGWVLEFQHSYLKPDERKSRNDFYSKIVWVVDGRRRKKDKDQLLKVVDAGSPLAQNRNIVRVDPDGSALLRDWESSSKPVFFDIGTDCHLLVMLPRVPGPYVYITVLPRIQFLNLHLLPSSDAVEEFDRLLAEFALGLSIPPRPLPHQPNGFQLFQQRLDRSRGRF